MKLLDKTPAELNELMLSLGYPAFRAQQIYSGLMHGKKLGDIKQLPESIRRDLDERRYTSGGVEIYKKIVSQTDGTIKYLYLLEDGNIIEGVVMKYRYGNTVCVSTQVGCRMGCAFCASTIGGLVRSLSAGEILGQVIAASIDNSDGKERGITNIVLMGSGEPLDNFDEVVKFLELVGEKTGLGVSMRNISVSTCGLVPRIYDLALLKLGITLSLSLHAPNDRIRSKLMPVSKAYSIEQTLTAMREYVKQTGRRVVFEYALVKNVNSSPECARELASRLHGLQCHVNLIPLNSVSETGLCGVDKKTVNDFLKTLTELGISATVRREMGDDIAGACGQLRRSVIDKKTDDFQQLDID